MPKHKHMVNSTLPGPEACCKDQMTAQRQQFLLYLVTD